MFTRTPSRHQLQLRNPSAREIIILCTYIHTILIISNSIPINVSAGRKNAEKMWYPFAY